MDTLYFIYKRLRNHVFVEFKILLLFIFSIYVNFLEFFVVKLVLS